MSPDAVLVPGLWALAAALAAGGIWRHHRRVRAAEADVAYLDATGINSWTRWAAERRVLNEHYRVALKTLLLLIAGFRTWVTTERAVVLAGTWDWRDLLQPLLFLLVLLLLTHWSTVTDQRGP